MLKQVKITGEYKNDKPQFLKPVLITYNRDGSESSWEMLKQHDSVHIIVQNITSYETLFVKQVRIPVLVNNPYTTGETVECCAGIIDKYSDELDPAERAKKIAIDEIREELGYDMPSIMLEPIKVLNSSVGTSGSKCHTFYAEVTDEMYIGQQLSLDEDIEVISIPTDELEMFMSNTETDASTMFLTQWLLQQ